MTSGQEGKVVNKSKSSLVEALSFIEVQFPVAKLSMESYKERKANYSQTLTGLGKWWGRKPLILVRAILLGLLIPASDEPEIDREIFLKLLTMDREGLELRKCKSIPQKELLRHVINLPPSQRERFADGDGVGNKYKLKSRLSREEKEALQLIVFNRLTYDEKLNYCLRPEQITGISKDVWREINDHLGTKSSSLVELIEELGKERFGHRPRVGDAFCGGGSIPFEAARIGCDIYGSDLNPFAALLTWSSLNIIGGGNKVVERVLDFQKEVYQSVDNKIKDWGIEENSDGWRADAYLHCLEVLDPESGWKIPLSSTWIIGIDSKTIARLVPDPRTKQYSIEIIQGASEREISEARKYITISNSRIVPPDGSHETPIEVLRQNMRLWNKEDLIPEPNDVFQERLYCIRWVETYINNKGKKRSRRVYRSPTIEDFENETKVLKLLHERLNKWQDAGYLPLGRIEPGDETTRLQRERGWTHWHHLFTPRQLLTHGLLMQEGLRKAPDNVSRAAIILGVSRLADWNSKLCRWDSSSSNERVAEAFYNQALNPFYNYAGKALPLYVTNWYLRVAPHELRPGIVEPKDARDVNFVADFWITDPPYADAINYHELSEHFLSWIGLEIPKLFNGWYSDSKRELAVKGSDKDFRLAMIDCYKNLVAHMPDDGMQVVMFTHQDASVWAELTSILWAAGLRVTAAWTIATETDSSFKQGNYVQGTVMLILRKRNETIPIFLDEIANDIELEVKKQLDTMLSLDDESDPNFGDADYQLAAYAAALRVLTQRPIHEIDPAKEILRKRKPGETSPVEKVIRNAVKVACDHLVPRGFDHDHWKRLSPMERFYLKGLEVESHGEYRNGVYQELGRGFGATEYADLLASTKANQTRLKTGSEFGKKGLSGDDFGSSMIRHCLFAIYHVVKEEATAPGLTWLRTELADYWGSRERVIEVLDYLSRLGRVGSMEHWSKDAHAASLLSGAIRNDHV